MRSKLFVAVIAGSFLFAGVSSTVAQEKVAKKDVKTEQKVDVKKADTKVKPKAAKKKAKTEKCSAEEKSNCTKECGAE